MTWLAVVRKDFNDAIRSRLLWALSGLFVVFTAGFAYVYTLLAGEIRAPESLTALNFMLFLVPAVGIFVPVTALAVGYRSLAGEAETGKLKLTLSLPHSRREVVAGKFVGRTGVVAVPILVGFAIAAALVVVLYSGFSPANYLLFTLLTVVFGMSFVGIAVGISASTQSSTKAAAGAFGTFLVFQFVWGTIPSAVHYLLEGSFFPAPPQPDWYLLINQLRPSDAYGTVVRALLPADSQFAAGGDLPFFATWWFGLLVLLAWTVLPLVLGTLRFEDADL